jgi:hypothetical protein
MALIPLNTFKTKTAVLTTSTQGATTSTTIYTAPIGTTAIILMTQVTNITTQTAYISFGHYRRLAVLPDAQGNGGQAGSTYTPMVVSYAIPKNNASNVTTGKMIIESLDSIRAWSSTPNSLQITLSVLETANA